MKIKKIDTCELNCKEKIITIGNFTHHVIYNHKDQTVTMSAKDFVSFKDLFLEFEYS